MAQVSFGEALRDIAKGSTIIFEGMRKAELRQFLDFADSEGVKVAFADEGNGRVHLRRADGSEPKPAKV